MGEITLRYFPYSPAASFLQIKQTEVTTLPYYLPVFYIHVYSSMFCLLAGFTQFNPYFLKKKKKVHRSLGYLYVLTALMFSAPTGFVMGLHANGGIVAVLFFTILALLWSWFTFKALLAAKNKNFVSHKNYMVRSYALALSAITLRLWKVVLVYFFEPAPMDVYVIIAGLGWIPNLLIAEYIIQRKANKPFFYLALKTLKIKQ
ncbi:MAG: DUF2306 domain-containing protein [Sphingobacteriales bacterium]|nr:MAG: DUF2306 domain-containing protein [Sphingobacteriales bacterium]